MSKLTYKGSFVETSGDLPESGSIAPGFNLVDNDFTESSLSDYTGKKIILNIFMSVDSLPCARSIRKFNEEAQKNDDVVVLCISMDLPFAHDRFISAEGLERVKNLSAFRNPEFGIDYGVTIKEGPLKGIFSRAIVVINESGKVIYTEHVSEISNEPDYKQALKSVAGRKQEISKKP